MFGRVLHKLRIVIQGKLGVRPPPPPACPGGFLYAVSRGDNLNGLATRFRVSRAALVAANPQVTNWRGMAVGQLICIPMGEAFEVCLLLRRTEQAPPAAAGVVLARGDPDAGSQVLIALTGVPEAEVTLRRGGDGYRTEPVARGFLDLREPTGMLTHFERVEVRSGGILVLEALGSASLPQIADSALAPF